MNRLVTWVYRLTLLLSALGAALLVAGCRTATTRPADLTDVQQTQAPAIVQSPPAPAGAPLLAESFDQPAASVLVSGADEEARYSLVDGAYQIEVVPPQTIAWSSVAGNYPAAVAAVDATVFTDDAAAGLVFGYRDARHLHLFSVSADGYYRLDNLHDAAWQTLIDWTPTGAAAPAGQVNRLQVAFQAERIGLYLNNIPLEETIDRSFSGGGVALAAQSFTSGGAAVRFDNLLITSHE